MEKNRGVIYGVNSVFEAVQTNGKSRLKTIVVEDRKHGASINKIIELAHSKNIAIEKCKSGRLEKLSGTHKNQGIVAIVVEKKSLNLDELLRSLENQNKKYPTLVIIDRAQDPRNLGALIRSAEGLGIDGVVISGRKSSGITPVVSKVSAGAIEHIPVVTVSNIANTIEHLKKKGFWIVAAEAGGEKNCYEIDFLMPVVVLIGGEESGVRQILKNKCDIVTSIPMVGKVSSLNLSVAGAIIFYEILRQKKNEYNISNKS